MPNCQLAKYIRIVGEYDSLPDYERKFLNSWIIEEFQPQGNPMTLDEVIGHLNPRPQEHLQRKGDI